MIGSIGGHAGVVVRAGGVGSVAGVDQSEAFPDPGLLVEVQRLGEVLPLGKILLVCRLGSQGLVLGDAVALAPVGQGCDEILEQGLLVFVVAVRGWEMADPGGGRSLSGEDLVQDCGGEGFGIQEVPHGLGAASALDCSDRGEDQGG